MELADDGSADLVVFLVREQGPGFADLEGGGPERPNVDEDEVLGQSAEQQTSKGALRG